MRFNERLCVCVSLGLMLTLPLQGGKSAARSADGISGHIAAPSEPCGSVDALYADTRNATETAPAHDRAFCSATASRRDRVRLAGAESGSDRAPPSYGDTADQAQLKIEAPLSFDDPVFAKTKADTRPIKVPPGSSVEDLSIIDTSGQSTITCGSSCNLTRVRIQSREGVRCVSGNINLSWVYIAATGIENDHADGVQCYSPGSSGMVTVRNSTFKMAGATTAGYWSADDWRGAHVLENVLFEGGAYGLRIPADGGSSVSLKNVYFVRGSFRYGAFSFDVVKGRRIKITQWENVRWVIRQGDRLVVGGRIPQPQPY